MEGRLGNGEAAGGGLVMRPLLNTAILAAAVVASVSSASAQVNGEGRRYNNGNTASFFFYDNRNDQRDLPTNGGFPGNFAANPWFAGVGASGWLESNPQHSAQPYPSQTYTVNTGRYVTCPHTRVEQAADGRRYVRCLTPQ